jgi:hypothetical protein
MRRSTAGWFVLLSALTALAPGAQAARPVTGDWVLMIADGGATGTADGSSVAAARMVLTGGPWVSGLGGSYPREYAGVTVFTDLGSDPVEVRTSREAGGLSMHARPTDVAGTYESTMTANFPALAPRAKAYALFFKGNARLTVTKLFHAPWLHVRYVVGSGTKVIRHVDAVDGGVGVSAGPLAAAALATHDERPRAGIVGAFATSFMMATGLPTTGTWSGPGGRRGTFTFAAFATPQTGFAGPSGLWSWHWSGAGQGMLQAPVVAAYAPVGAVWPAFVPSSR